MRAHGFERLVGSPWAVGRRAVSKIRISTNVLGSGTSVRFPRQAVRPGPKIEATRRTGLGYIPLAGVEATCLWVLGA